MKLRALFLKNNSSYGYLIALLVLIRAYFNAVIPLTDKTEARYSEIARLMAETGNWVVPQIDYGVPFWAKPPLSTWASALSISIFGNHEFFVRLPYLLVSIFIALWAARFTAEKTKSYLPAAFILFTLPEFYLHAGVVSTDTMLNLSIAMVMLAFWKMVSAEKKWLWNVLFFSGMGLGLLAKGSIVGILTLPPILAWSLYQKKLLQNIGKIVWLPGVFIMLAISLPWYFLAEIKSPGFVDYFIVGEHFKRYFDAAWAGDKYGFPKQQPLGIIWVFLIAFALPWSILLFRVVFKKFKTILKSQWASFLLFWMLWTPLFFTISKSLIHPYTLPVMLPIALLIAHYWENIRLKAPYVLISILLPLILFAVYTTGVVRVNDFSDKYLVAAHADAHIPLYALNEKSYSAQFYSQGSIRVMKENTLDEHLMEGTPFYIIISHKQYQSLPLSIQKKLLLKRQHVKKGVYFFDPTQPL